MTEEQQWNVGSEPAYNIILLDPGNDLDKTIDTISTITSTTTEQVHAMFENPPITLMQCVGESFVVKVINMFESIGAQVEVSLAEDCD